MGGGPGAAAIPPGVGISEKTERVAPGKPHPRYVDSGGTPPGVHHWQKWQRFARGGNGYLFERARD